MKLKKYEMIRLHSIKALIIIPIRESIKIWTACFSVNLNPNQLRSFLYKIIEPSYKI